MSEEDKIIRLAFSSPNTRADDSVTFHCCTVCRNKTFTLVVDRPECLPMLKCAACGAEISRIGFAHDDDPAGSRGPNLAG